MVRDEACGNKKEGSWWYKIKGRLRGWDCEIGCRRKGGSGGWLQNCGRKYIGERNEKYKGFYANRLSKIF